MRDIQEEVVHNSKIVYWIERYVLEGSSVFEYTQYIDMRTVKSGLDQGSVPFQLNSLYQLPA